MIREFRVPFSDGGGPAFLVWLRSFGIFALLAVDDEDEFVEFDIPTNWSWKCTERFAQSLIHRIVEIGSGKLAELRATASPQSPTLSLAVDLKRLADHFSPPSTNKVGSEYIAEKLGCTTTWVAQLARRGEIPKNCIVPGTGKGNLWKFHRSLVDRWIEQR